MSDETKLNCPANSGGEPVATNSPVPMAIVVLTLTLLFLGGVYFDHHSGWFNAKVYTPYVSVEHLDLYQPKSGATAALALGRAKYELNCGICHGNDGMGKPAMAPPLAGSEWVNATGFHRLAQIPLNGLNGSFQVKGKEWNQPMAPMGANLSDADLAAVLTYIRTSWGNKAGLVSAYDVKTIRAAVAGHPAISAAQLSSIPE